MFWFNSISNTEVLKIIYIKTRECDRLLSLHFAEITSCVHRLVVTEDRLLEAGLALLGQSLSMNLNTLSFT